MALTPITFVLASWASRQLLGIELRGAGINAVFALLEVFGGVNLISNMLRASYSSGIGVKVGREALALKPKDRNSDEADALRKRYRRYLPWLAPRRADLVVGRP